MTRPRRPSPRRFAAALAGCLLAAGAMPGPTVGQGDPAADAGGRITLYTSVTDDTVEAVLTTLAAMHPSIEVDVFRAPTGELDARIASERRTGGIAADVLWMTDPLSIQRYEADGLLAPLDGAAFDSVPDAYRGETFAGTRLLNLVLVTGSDVQPRPAGWSDLTDRAYEGRVALPDPRFAGSAFAAMGHFATAPDLGMDFYRALSDNGAVQVRSPVDTLVGVAEGNYDVGITLDKIARANIEAGAPIELIWPAEGAIAVFSPVAVVAATDAPAAARAFAAFLVTPEAQAAIARTGWQPVRGDIEWPYDGAAVSPDWGELYGRQEHLLAEYDAIFPD